jgi:hypothetical protein
VEDVKALFQNHLEYNRGSMYDLAECVAIGGPKSIDGLNPKDWYATQRTADEQTIP